MTITYTLFYLKFPSLDLFDHLRAEMIFAHGAHFYYFSGRKLTKCAMRNCGQTEVITVFSAGQGWKRRR